MASDQDDSSLKQTSNFISIGAAIEAVQALPYMDEDLLFEAFDFLENGKNAAMFIAINAKLRSKWLRKKLCPKAMEILVKAPDGKTLTLNNVFKLTKIEELKDKIQAMKGLPSSQTRLIYCGKLLEDGRTISDYGLKDGSVMHMIIRICGC